jgi:hypothetical protein
MHHVEEAEGGGPARETWPAAAWGRRGSRWLAGWRSATGGVGEVVLWLSAARPAATCPK